MNTKLRANTHRLNKNIDIFTTIRPGHRTHTHTHTNQNFTDLQIHKSTTSQQHQKHLHANQNKCAANQFVLVNFELSPKQFHFICRICVAYENR